MDRSQVAPQRSAAAITAHTLDVRLGRLAALAADLPYYWSLLDRDEQSRAQALKSPQRQAHYIETHGRLRQVLGETVAAAPKQLQFACNAHGKPYLANYPEVAFNLSHTSDRIALVLSRNGRVGIDIESCKPRPHLAALADKCFGAAEKAYWLTLPEAERLPAFFRFWTRKEAFVKAVGQGITLGLQRCVTDPAQPRMLRVPPSCGLAEDWSLHDLDPGDGVCGAIAVEGAIARVHIGTF